MTVKLTLSFELVSSCHSVASPSSTPPMATGRGGTLHPAHSGRSSQPGGCTCWRPRGSPVEPPSGPLESLARWRTQLRFYSLVDPNSFNRPSYSLVVWWDHHADRCVVENLSNVLCKTLVSVNSHHSVRSVSQIFNRHLTLWCGSILNFISHNIAVSGREHFSLEIQTIELLNSKTKVSQCTP